MANPLKDRRDYRKKKREDYIQKIKDEYQINGHIIKETKTYKCPLCNGEHEIDQYDFVDSCIGYFWMDNMAYHIIEWGKKHNGKTK